MSEIPSITGHNAGLSGIASRSNGHKPVVININPKDAPKDSVEVSQTAQLLARMAELPDIRQDLVDRVKSQIEAGTYLTDDKVDAALQNMLEDLDV